MQNTPPDQYLTGIYIYDQIDLAPRSHSIIGMCRITDCSIAWVLRAFSAVGNDRLSMIIQIHDTTIMRY